MGQDEIRIRVESLPKRQMYYVAALASVGMPILFAHLLASGSTSIWQTAGVIVVAVFVIFVLVYPEYLFSIIYPLFFIIGQVPIPLGDGTISVERALVILGGAGIAVGMFLSRRLPLLRLPRFVAPGLLLWLGLYILSYFVLPSDKGAVLVLGFVQKAIMGYIVFISLADSERVQWAASMFVVASFLASLFTVYAYAETGSLQFIRVSSFIAADETAGGALLRGLARVGAGNTMAVWIALMYLKLSRGRWGRLFWGGAVLWFVLLSLFALRREVLVALPVGMAYLWWHQAAGVRRQVMAIGGLALVVGVVFLSIDRDWGYRLFTETSEEYSEGADPRIALLARFTPAALIASPWIGHGPGSYESTQLLFPEQLTHQILAHDGIASHNSWSSAVVEAGVFALAGLCLMVYGIGRGLFRMRSTGDRRLDILGSFAPLVFIQILLTLFFGDGIAVSQTWFWFGFLLAVDLVRRQASRSVMA